MLNIDDHHDDPYLADFTARRDAHLPSPHDRANAALAKVDLGLLAVKEQGDDLDQAQAEAIVERVALAASACAKATRVGEDRLALEFARVAEGEALVLSAFKYVNVDGLRRMEVFAA